MRSSGVLLETAQKTKLPLCEGPAACLHPGKVHFPLEEYRTARVTTWMSLSGVHHQIIRREKKEKKKEVQVFTISRRASEGYRASSSPAARPTG